MAGTHTCGTANLAKCLQLFHSKRIIVWCYSLADGRKHLKKRLSGADPGLQTHSIMAFIWEALWGIRPGEWSIIHVFWSSDGPKAVLCCTHLAIVTPL